MPWPRFVTMVSFMTLQHTWWGIHFHTMLLKNFLSSLLVSVGPPRREREVTFLIPLQLFFCLYLPFWHSCWNQSGTDWVNPKYSSWQYSIPSHFCVDSITNTRSCFCILLTESDPNYPSQPPLLSSGCCPLGLYWTREEREASVLAPTDSCTLCVS